MNLTASITNTYGTYTITADLTHNSDGNDTSSSGNLPDSIPINFTATFGMIGTTTYTNRGKADSILTLTAQGEPDVSASLDNETINETYVMTGNSDLLYQKLIELNNLSLETDISQVINCLQTIRNIINEQRSSGYSIVFDESMPGIVITPPAEGTSGDTYAQIFKSAMHLFEMNGEFIYFKDHEHKTICPDCQWSMFLNYYPPENNIEIHWSLVELALSFKLLDDVTDIDVNELTDDIKRQKTNQCNDPYCPFGAPDLTATIDNLPNNPQVGNNYIISTTITNHGFHDCGAFHVQFLSNHEVIGDIIVSYLEQDSTKTLQFDWKPMESMQYELMVYADAIMTHEWGEIYETSENNNWAIATVDVGKIPMLLLNTISYPSSSDPTKPYKVVYLYKSEIPVYLDPGTSPTFVFKTTNPVFSDTGFQPWFPYGAGKLYISNSADGPWTSVYSYPYFVCQGGVDEYRVKHWATGTGYYNYFMVEMYTTALPWQSGILKTFMDDFCAY